MDDLAVARNPGDDAGDPSLIDQPMEMIVESLEALRRHPCQRVGRRCGRLGLHLAAGEASRQKRAQRHARPCPACCGRNVHHVFPGLFGFV
jgi:hypothetical protein